LLLVHSAIKDLDLDSESCIFNGLGLDLDLAVARLDTSLHLSVTAAMFVYKCRIKLSGSGLCRSTNAAALVANISRFVAASVRPDESIVYLRYGSKNWSLGSIRQRRLQPGNVHMWFSSRFGYRPFI